ncbi:hypothetical protein [Enterobacter hormaechei]|uniref:hypothetical protein n=1 Tax=Enterobacter hormaechei TaxID=158836 RepID=UPI001D100BBD|nr:hypothetical protein [Enterobacter hormaechei]UDV40229.1 hypothetical protein LJU43_24330 [Enterobacter hormaechei]
MMLDAYRQILSETEPAVRTVMLEFLESVRTSLHFRPEHFQNLFQSQLFYPYQFWSTNHLTIGHFLCEKRLDGGLYIELGARCYGQSVVSGGEEAYMRCNPADTLYQDDLSIPLCEVGCLIIKGSS